MLLRIKQVEEVTSLSKSTIYRLIRQGKFPKPLKLTAMRRVGWHPADIQAFFSACAQNPIAARLDATGSTKPEAQPATTGSAGF